MPHKETYLAGVAYRSKEARAIADALAEGDELTLELEPSNEHDPDAVAVFREGVHIGYITSYHATEIAAWVRLGRVAKCCASRGSKGGLKVNIHQISREDAA